MGGGFKNGHFGAYVLYGWSPDTNLPSCEFSFIKICLFSKANYLISMKEISIQPVLLSRVEDGSMFGEAS